MINRIRVENASVIFSRPSSWKRGKGSLKESILSKMYSIMKGSEKDRRDFFCALRDLTLDVQEGEVRKATGKTYNPLSFSHFTQTCFTG